MASILAGPTLFPSDVRVTLTLIGVTSGRISATDVHWHPDFTSFPNNHSQLALDSPAMVLSFILIQNRQWVALSPFGWFGAGD